MIGQSDVGCVCAGAIKGVRLPTTHLLQLQFLWDESRIDREREIDKVTEFLCGTLEIVRGEGEREREKRQ